MADYITLAELASTLSLTETFADDDLALAITAASREVDRKCGRWFYQVSGARYYTATDSRRVWIDDLLSLSSFEVDMGGDGSWSSWVVNTQFVFEPFNAAADGQPWTTVTVRDRSGAYLPVWDRAVRVTGQFGWTAVPAQVKQATSVLATRFMKRAREAPFGVAGFGMDGGAVRVANFDPDVDALLAAFVRVNHAL